ncbi:MAG TPA: SGNH family hydrolase, partial [Hyphomicrobiales bacterium]|nr:SGNH family hydrolase [Hyphomicrobiales bacterium]
GDSLASGLADALDDAFSETPTVEIFERTRGDSGLVRYDHYDWSVELAEILANEEVNAAVVMIGSNDRQPMRLEDRSPVPTRSAQWEEIYISRVDDILRQFSEKNIQVYWVGLPIMRPEGYAQDMAYLNEIYLARAQRAGARFIDTWARFADEEGRYSPVGPDVNGKIRRLRAENGIFLTPTGNRKLAFFVEQVLGADLEAGGLARISNLGAGALPRGLRGPVEIELSLTNPGTPPANATLIGAAPPEEQETAGGPLDETASGIASLAAEEAAGEAASAPSAEAPIGPSSPPPDAAASGLSSLPADLPTNVLAPDPEIERADYRLLVLGESPEPELGRADDFSWPRSSAAGLLEDVYR